MNTIIKNILVLSILFLLACNKNEKSGNSEQLTELKPSFCKIDKYDFVDSTEEALIFDTLNRLVSLVKIQNNRKEEIDFTYNAEGRLTQIFDKEGLEYELYEYDQAGNLVKEIVYDDSVADINLKEYQIHEYNNNLRVKTTYFEVSDESKTGVAREINIYSYDSAGNIKEINAELILEKKKFLQAKYEYLNKGKNYDYPLAYNYNPGKNLLSKFTLFAQSGRPASIYTYIYEFNDKGNPIKIKTIKEKANDKGKNVSIDTTSVLSLEYINCK